MITLALFFVVIWSDTAVLEPRVSDVERACYAQIQGQIAWDHKGNRRWNDDNIDALCRGVLNPAEPGSCFAEVMHGNSQWDGGRNWAWEEAVALCRGSNDAAWTVGCFRQARTHNYNWQQAINHCAGMNSEFERYPAYGFDGPGRLPSRPRESCKELVQGRIAWNAGGDRVWTKRYLDRLCHGSRDPAEPGRCYQRLMSGKVNWGGGNHWEPDNALSLCAGSDNAQDTLECFEDSIYRGDRWDLAIARCNRK